MDQHQLLIEILCAAGGRQVEDLLPQGYVGERADVAFKSENLIAEIKSFTSDRRHDPQVAAKLGVVMDQNADAGAPAILGPTSVRLHELPKPIAEQALRVVGARVRKEVSKARSQIAATRTALEMPEAYGLIVFVSPPERLGNQTMAWLLHDALKQSGRMDGLDGAMIVETPFGWPDRQFHGSDSFSAVWSISGRPMPEHLGDRVAVAWERLTRQVARHAEVEDFVALGGAE